MKVRPLIVAGGAIVVAMLAVTAWAWPQIPDGASIPVHWNADGAADGYGPKWLGLLGIPVVALGIVALLAVLPRIEPRRRNLERSSTAYLATGIAVVGFLGALHLFAVLAAIGNDVDITAVALIGTGVLFLVIGNFMGKTRSSWFFGIRTPWTLSSELSWTRTHRMGRWVFLVAGAAIIVTTVWLGGIAAVWVMLATLGVGITATFAYSYLVWRDDPARQGSEAVR
jgi:uncharacterized membrane protein